MVLLSAVEMFKRVLTATDMLGACELATKLAQRYGSKLFLFHMLATPETEREIKEKLMEFCKMPEGVDHEYTIWEGALPYLEILKYAREKDVDLIVMGSHTKEKGEGDMLEVL